VDTANLLQAVPRLSPLAWSLAYQFPVHRIGRGYRPQRAAEEPTYLVVYRDPGDRVRFMEVSAASARLRELIRDNADNATLAALLARLAREMAVEVASIRSFALEQVAQLVSATVVLVHLPGSVN